MLRFLKYRERRDLQQDQALDRVAYRVARAVSRRQIKTARWLNRKYGRLSLRARKGLLLLFCLLLGAPSGHTLLLAMRPGPEKVAGLPATVLPLPAPPPAAGQRVGTDSLLYPSSN